MDETSIAFDSPMARAVATGGTELLDRISVRDHIREVEIGAFRAERGVTQRIRFNVVLEVAAHSAAKDDDVDKVVSYDTITQAITDILAEERINLLETLAERLAARILDDPRAVRAFVRIEKLDRIPGALGVEIARTRLPMDAPVIAPVKQVEVAPSPAARVVFLTDATLTSPDLPRWLDAIAASGPAVICVPPRPDFASDLTGEAALRQMLLSVEQTCWQLAARDARIQVADTRTELDWALANGILTVWAPQRLFAAAVGRPEITDPADLAIWLGEQLQARSVHIVGGDAAPQGAQLHALDTAASFPA